MQPAPLGAWPCSVAPEIKRWEGRVANCLGEPLGAAAGLLQPTPRLALFGGGDMMDLSKTNGEQGRDGNPHRGGRQYVQSTALPVASGRSSAYFALHGGKGNAPPV